MFPSAALESIVVPREERRLCVLEERKRMGCLDLLSRTGGRRGTLRPTKDPLLLGRAKGQSPSVDLFADLHHSIDFCLMNYLQFIFIINIEFK